MTRIVRREVPDHAAWPPSIPNVLGRIFAARGVLRPEDAELKLARLLPPDTMGHLQAAVRILADAMIWDRTWVSDFADDDVQISADLYEVLTTYAQMRPSA